MLERLLQFLKVFWSFAKGAQDAFVARLESSSNLMVIVELHVFLRGLEFNGWSGGGSLRGWEQSWPATAMVCSWKACLPDMCACVVGHGPRSLQPDHAAPSGYAEIRWNGHLAFISPAFRHSSQINHVVSQDVFAFPPILNPAISLLSAGPCSFQFKSFNLRHELGQRAREGGSIFSSLMFI